MNTANNQKEINVGVDTGKYQLDIFIRPLGIYFTVDNTDNGIKEAIKVIKKHQPHRVIIEATGRLEHAFVLACSEASLPIVIANPYFIRRFSGAIGQLAKTDKLDAQLIAHYGEMIKPKLTLIKPASIRLMSDLMARRRQLVTLQTMEKNRLSIMPSSMVNLIKPIITCIKKQIEKVDKKLEVIIEKHPAYKAKSDIIQSMPGVGKVLSMSLISNMPELGFINNKQAASLIGVAPMNRESGRYQGQRKIKGGRSQIRTVMFMAMMSAIQCNPIFKSQYKHLVSKGKPKKMAVIACMRKMIIILNSMIRDGVCWNENYAK